MKYTQVLAGMACLALATMPHVRAADGPDIDDPEERETK